jgi:hypothetical protein
VQACKSLNCITFLSTSSCTAKVRLFIYVSH